MVESAAQTPATAAPEMTEAQIERQMAMKYQQLQKETNALVQRLMEVEDEKRENEMVLEQVMKLEEDRKCWRLINGVLFEKPKCEVVPELQAMAQNLGAVAKQINTTLVAMKQESIALERQYTFIMEAAKRRAGQAAEEGPAAAKSTGGVLV